MVFGNSASVVMIKYSNILSYVGLMIISAITLITIFKLYKDLKTSKSNKILIEGEQRNSR